MLKEYVVERFRNKMIDAVAVENAIVNSVLCHMYIYELHSVQLTYTVGEKSQTLNLIHNLHTLPLFIRLAAWLFQT
jgi:hypothetical protein